MARVPYVQRDELDAEGQAIYDRIRQDRNSPEVGLQFRALLHSPLATGYLTSLGAQLRFQSAIPEDLKELAIILVAREWNSAIEWTGHAVLAARAGLAELASRRAHGDAAGLSDARDIARQAATRGKQIRLEGRHRESSHLLNTLAKQEAQEAKARQSLRELGKWRFGIVPGQGQGAKTVAKPDNTATQRPHDEGRAAA
jgi:hypothetical protein